MATTVNQARRLRFATQLRNALDEDGSSIRALAKKLNPQAPETARSNLMRYLRAAHMPSRSSRREIALTLGLPADYFEGDDDEESDPVAALFNLAALDAFLLRRAELVAARVAEATAA